MKQASIGQQQGEGDQGGNDTAETLNEARKGKKGKGEVEREARSKANRHREERNHVNDKGRKGKVVGEGIGIKL